MAYVFYLLGWLAIIGGLWIMGIAYQSSNYGLQTDQYARAGAALGFLAVAAPGGVLFLFGLVVLGIGGGLARLDSIARYSKQTAKIMKEMAPGPNQ